ncbi:MAG: GNAT family N-acetyltransferase [Chitinivibrionales bacterium]|nr:GNAT family N-acetyltransferase [Chitinivibrionales bacterium]
MPAETKGLYALQKRDTPKAGAVLADAFRHDPLWDRLFAGLSDVERRRRAFFETPVRYCRRFGEAYATSERLEGIAAWVPDTFANMSMWRLLRSGALGCVARMGPKLARRIDPVLGPLQGDRQRHMQGTPFIYVQIVGVATALQGQGYGRRMLQAMIEKSEHDGRALYLETETERNAAMYERYGFRVLQRITLPIVELPMWEMVREPQRGSATPT